MTPIKTANCTEKCRENVCHYQWKQSKYNVTSRHCVKLANDCCDCLDDRYWNGRDCIEQTDCNCRHPDTGDLMIVRDLALLQCASVQICFSFLIQHCGLVVKMKSTPQMLI
jgi:hypothetical protein